MKIIPNFTHHMDDYECMWNGIEDIYINKGCSIPTQFFFAMAGFCSFAYIKTNKAPIKRMISFGEGRTKQMYAYLSNIVNFTYHHIESTTPEKALIKAKKEIDNNYPVVLGALDMYYLEYLPKLYHHEHIPFHYILMIGYDDDNQEILLYYCGREELQRLSYDNLMKAFNAEYPGLCKPNTICTIRMENPYSVKEIFTKALLDKAKSFLYPEVGFLGVKGLHKLAKEITTWEEELGITETKKIIRQMVEFMGSVPKAPNRLLGIDEKDDIFFMASRDKFSKTLKEISEGYNIDSFQNASELFLESGSLFTNMTNLFVDYLLDINKDIFDQVSVIINKISDIEKKAYEIIYNELSISH